MGVSQLFLRLFQRVLLAKLFKASMVCKGYSAVFLSLWINKDKTPVRVKCLAQLNVCLVLNLKGRGVRVGSSSSKFFWLLFQQRFQWKMLCPWAVDVPRLWTATPIHQLPTFVRALAGLSGLAISEFLSISHGVLWGCKGSIHTHSWESIAATALVMVTHFSLTQEKLLLSQGPQQYQGPCRRAAPAFGRLRGSQESQAGLAGCGGGHDLAMVRQKVTLRSYFFPWMVFNKHLCVRQSHPQPQGESRPTCSLSPAGTRSLARDAVLCPAELSRALGSLLQCKP